MKKLEAAADYSLKNTISNLDLGDALANYGFYEKSLAVKRIKPKFYPYERDVSSEIAVLATKTQNWPLFWSIHRSFYFNMMVRDGDYASGNTFTPEMEAINIQMQDILLSFAFYSSQNLSTLPARSIAYLMSNSSNKDVIEANLLEIIQDEKTDLLNRITAYKVYKNLLTFEKLESDKAQRRKRLNKAALTLPTFLFN